MKTSITSMITMITLMLQPWGAVNAQVQNYPAPAELLASLDPGAAMLAAADADTRYELVDASYAPAPYSADALLRVVERLGDGRYGVRVIGADGILRMSGTYADEALTQPDGSFEYFHMTGQLESRGAYKMGRKDGIWERYGMDGAHLAERVYVAQTWEQLQVALGDAMEVCTAD